MRDACTLSVDTSRWPLVILTYAGRPSSHSLGVHLEEIEQRVLARKASFLMIIDQLKGEMPDAVQRAQIARHQERMESAYKAHCLGEAYVVTSELRAAMTAVFWLAPPPYPYAFVANMREALAFAETRMREAQLA